MLVTTHINKLESTNLQFKLLRVSIHSFPRRFFPKMTRLSIHIFGRAKRDRFKHYLLRRRWNQCGLF